ncbi:hypothetical protein [Sphingomonas lenta]|uniref:hypothetical protein n=1 Tax=Sphingomonas lenta TaxID=1141887 RepID=UPI001FEB3A8A|nr:hypothetical protein [Sphingomonas lenta]
MDRPPSIKQFERLWWASTLLWGLGTWLAWERTTNALNANARTAQVAGLALWGNVALVLGLSVLLWWLAARRGSAIGKWLVVAAAAMSGVRVAILVIGLVNGANLHPLSQGAFLLSAALTVWSAVMLFRPDARRWFGEDEGEFPA